MLVPGASSDRNDASLLVELTVIGVTLLVLPTLTTVEMQAWKPIALV